MVNLNQQKKCSRTNLSFSPFIFSGKPEIVRLLIENGTDINAENNLKRTPIFEAAAYGMNIPSCINIASST